MIGGTSDWEIALTVATIVLTVATISAVGVALYVAIREGHATRASLRISQRLLEHAEEDRRDAKAALVVIEWAEYMVPPSPNSRSGPKTEYRLRIHNAGRGVATNVTVESPESLGLGLRGEENVARVNVLGPGRSATPLGRMWMTPGIDYPTVSVSWTDANGTHQENRTITTNRDE